GVQVGKVEKITLNEDRARVKMRIDQGVKIDEESIAGIKTRGIIGSKYVSIAPGAGEKYLKEGDQIRQTEGAFVLEDVIGQLINSAGTGGGKGENSDKSGEPPNGKNASKDKGSE